MSFVAKNIFVPFRTVKSSTATRSSSFLTTRSHTSSRPIAKVVAHRKMSSSASPSTPFLEAIQARRSYYQITKSSPIPDSKIVSIVQSIVLHSPSSFNAQSARAVILLKADHEEFWDIVLEALKPIVPEGQLEGTKARIAGFKGGYGTILWYEDPEPTETLKKNLPLYAEHFGEWAEHASGFHQIAVWTALEKEGLGASLQHYGNLVSAKVAARWNVPADWKFSSQLVFGAPGGEPGPKDFKPIEDRVKVHGASS